MRFFMRILSSSASAAAESNRRRSCTLTGRPRPPMRWVPSDRISTRSIGWRAASLAAAARSRGASTPAPSNSTYRCDDTPPSCCSSWRPTHIACCIGASGNGASGSCPSVGSPPVSRGAVGTRLRRGVVGKQIGPRLHGGIGGQHREPDVDAPSAPPPRQRHHPDGVQAGCDQVGVRVQLFGVDAEEFGDLGSDLVGTRQPLIHSGSPHN